MRLIFAVAGAIALCASSAACVRTDNHYHCKAESRDHGNAGCAIVADHTALIVQQQTGKWNLPGGTQDGQENARCTAERETYEETGLRVEAGRLLHRYSNDFYLYECSVRFRGQLVNPIDVVEVADVRWVALQDLTSLDWRFPEFTSKTLAIFAEIGD